MKHKLEYIIFLFLEKFFFLLPFFLSQKIGKCLGKISYYLISKRRKIAIENLKKSFPEKTENEINFIAKKSFENFLTSFAEFFSIQKFSQKKILNLVQFENLEELKKKIENKSAIILSAHFGNWELLAISIGLFFERKVNLVVKPQHNKFVDKRISMLRTKFGNYPIPMNNVSEILKCLNEKKLVAILSDQSAPKESVYVNFFGQQVSTFSGTSVFALRTNSPIILILILREKKNFKLIWEEILFEKKDDNDAIKKLTQIHTTAVENFIRKFPTEWLWMHRRWKNTQ